MSGEPLTAFGVLTLVFSPAPHPPSSILLQEVIVGFSRQCADHFTFLWMELPGACGHASEHVDHCQATYGCTSVEEQSAIGEKHKATVGILMWCILEG